MSMLAFLFEATLISLSGVIAPGPITATVVGRGSQSPHAGALVAIGHGIVEFPLMVAVFYGVGQLFDLPYVKMGIALVGGLFLLAMGIGMLRSIGQEEVGLGEQRHTPVVAGIVLSVGNPYFLVWWATVGAALILRSVAFGVWGLVAFGLLHWLCDFVWSYFLSALSFKGGQFFGRWFQRAIFWVCGGMLLFFGARLVIDGIRGLV
jgi:threonine/homoserine/homoserine lactone efflux protein